MLRYRRYRVFLAFAIFTIVALYRFTTVREWEVATASSVEKLKSYTGQSYRDNVPKEEILQSQGTSKYPNATPTETLGKAEDWELALKTSIEKVEVKTLLATSTQMTEVKTSTLPVTTTAVPGRQFGLSGQGRLDAPPPLADLPAIHWERSPEHFPIPKDRIIPLPTGKPKSIPKIQHIFKDETATEKLDREKKQIQIKAAFAHSWKGYKDHAWMHDELKPISGVHKDVFCGWGATLVDALDTLWIMGFKDDFEQAAKALENIDFTTTTRGDIPLFETTIRYLGGLLSAYDVSEAKYPIILSKAQELGDVLLSAFDTPNRMPITYYNWRPTFAKNPHRAGTRTVLAELGSLSMEFTRLAQLTREDKYYDAVARITNELELIQSTTRVPGLWPDKIDASGCQKPPSPGPRDAIRQQEIANQARIGTISKSSAKLKEAEAESNRKATEAETAEKEMTIESKVITKSNGLDKRQLNPDEDKVEAVIEGLNTGSSHTPKLQSNETPKDTTTERKDDVAQKSATQDSIITANAESPRDNIVQTAGSQESVKVTAREKVDCVAQGLSSPPYATIETFKIGGSADSTYEYLPKMHLLLGGLNSQYSKMYANAIDAANEHLLFRAMIPENEREILVLGTADVRDGWREQPKGNFILTPEQSHLLCFTGGMWGMGAKLFDREGDLDIAKKITDGCIWGYENMASGIMPESMHMVSCTSRTNCSWNEPLWKEAIDPLWRERDTERVQAEQAKEEAAAQKAENAISQHNTDTVVDGYKVQNSEQDTQIPAVGQPTQGPLAKRQLEVDVTSSSTTTQAATTTSPLPQEVPTFNLHPSHDEFVERRMKDTRLPKGVLWSSARHYILRPEAIESVFIMYRMTGNEYWRQKGWMMWEAIERETKAEYGYSSIKDVTRKDYENNQDDGMESFWLAETLKYFYLLFSTPDVVSLDDWVL